MATLNLEASENGENVRNLKPFPKLTKKSPAAIPNVPVTPTEPIKDNPPKVVKATKRTPAKKKKAVTEQANDEPEVTELTDYGTTLPIVTKKNLKGAIVKKTTTIIPNCQSHILEQFKILFESNGIPYDDRISDLSKRTERAIYEFVQAQAKHFNLEPSWENPKFMELYLSKARSVLTNLDPKSYLNYSGQEKILQRFLSDDDDLKLTPEKLVNALPHELAPDRWKSMIEQRIHEAKISTKGFVTSTTDLFKCGKCKQRKCSYYQMQTRSQDEPMTTFVTCVNCGNKWRE